MARKQLTNAEYHKFLNLFADGVANGKYKKMPYDMYRKVRRITAPKVVLFLREFNTPNGYVREIVIDDNGPSIYGFDIKDGSFGEFAYNELTKETPMHPEEKAITYDIYGNISMSTATEEYCKKSDDPTLKQALNEYYTSKALSSAATSCSADKVSTVTIAGDPITWAGDIGWGSISTNVNTEIKTIAEVAKEEAELANNRINTIEQELKTKTSLSTIDTLESECRARYDELRWRIEELEHIERERKKQVDKLYSVTTQSTSSSIYPVKNYKINYLDGKENENMDTNKMFNFDFGPVAANIRMSPYGMAMKNADGKYVSYDKASGNIMDVEILNFDAQKFLYKMPVAVSAVAVGDIVVHMRKAMFVSAVNGNRISVVDIYNGEVKDIMPTTSPFGFNFITKVVSLIDMSGANTDSPFGNMLPLLMMGEGRDFKDILPIMLMMGGNTNFAQNPLMLYALMGDGNMDNILPFLLMAGNNPFAPAVNCGCSTHADHSHCDGNCHH